jgi:predicted anti-sigma-YlaC factor YlaD
MKHENEIVDGRLIMRIICGLLAAVGVWLIGSAVVELVAGTRGDGSSLWMPFSASFGTWLLAYYALTGRFPIRGERGGGDS